MSGWIGVDLDGTLANYSGWKGPAHIGKPVPAMLTRVKMWLAEGREVRIFTARVSEPADRASVIMAVQNWCVEHIGQSLPVTCIKDYRMDEIWDDRAVRVIANTGERCCESD